MSSPFSLDTEKQTQPTLPMGQVIDAKNTLQSFGTPFAMEEGSTLTLYAVEVNDLAVDTPPMVDAKAVSKEGTSSNIALDSESVPSLNGDADDVEINNENLGHVPSSRQKRCTPFQIGMYSAVVASLITLTLGIYFGIYHDDDDDFFDPVNSDGNCFNFSLESTDDSKFDDPTLKKLGDALTYYINNITLNDKNISIYGETPESKALNWIIDNYHWISDNKTELINLVPFPESPVGFRFQQLFPLTVIWFQNDQWNYYCARPDDTSRWLYDQNFCNWGGITCQTIDLGGLVGFQEVITDITLSGDWTRICVAFLPPDIGLLSNLRSLQIQGACDGGYRLQGTLPSSIGLLTALTNFDVSDNALTGTIPKSIAKWSSIDFAKFIQNDLVGTMPNEVCAFISGVDVLSADCSLEISCECCTLCYYE